jgi:hypothetical protein
MKAYLQVGLPAEAVKAAFRELTPLRIYLSPPEEDSRWIELDPPAEIEFEPGIGIRVVTTGKFKFELAAVKVPAYLDRVEFRLMPKIVQDEETGHRAAFPIEILDGDVRFIPGLLDDLIVSQVNRALSPSGNQLAWRFDEMLSKRFHIAERLAPLQAIGLKVSESEISVTLDELIMKVYYEIGFEKDAEWAGNAESIAPADAPAS